ncbi:hypothetical protein HQN87_08430 [Paenibacillus tritici]|uniref:Tail fiber protein n=1 Tax=Paenibacillus tritici TaxID=1873425 RepID=A0ABX2DL51_9BACL|nr:hypothetical protein [Paenibacillus tritici]NQX45356.1 hypothetical protein [Paenibacillus tritici]
MKTTGNLGLKKPEGTDIVDINDLNGNMDILDTAVNTIAQGLNKVSSFGTTAGTGTAYTLGLTPALAALTAGTRISFKAHVASGANPTLNPNGLGAKPLKKPNGNAAVLALNGVYTVVYDGTNFTLQGEGGEYGNATAADVRAGKNIGTDNGLVQGTATLVLTPGTGPYIHASGGSYSSNSLTGKIVFVEPFRDLIHQRIGLRGTLKGQGGPTNTGVEMMVANRYLNAINSPAGENDFDIEVEVPTGGLVITLKTANSSTYAILDNFQIVSNIPSVVPSMVSLDEGPATADDVLEGKTAYVNGNKLEGRLWNARNQLVGNMRVQSVLPGQLVVFPTVGGTAAIDNQSTFNIWDDNFIAANIKSGVEMLGLKGEYTGYQLEKFSENFTQFEESTDSTLSFSVTVMTSKSYIGHLQSIALTSVPDLMNWVTGDAFPMKFGGSCHVLDIVPDIADRGRRYINLDTLGPVCTIGIIDNGDTVALQIKRVYMEPTYVMIFFSYIFNTQANFQYYGYPKFDVELGGTF